MKVLLPGAFGLVFLRLACASSSSRESAGLSLLYQNDGNWTMHASADKLSFLLSHELVSYTDAVHVCRSLNETVVSSEVALKSEDLRQQYSYLEYTGNSAPTQHYWVAGSSHSGCTAYVPFGSKPAKLVSVSCTSKLQTICTNSALATTSVSQAPQLAYTHAALADGVTYTGTRDKLSFRFSGIPYAAPPVGQNRFRLPQPVARPANGTVDATAFKPACLQYGYFAGPNELNPWGNSEDCLYLNVYTPYVPGGSATPASLRKPVLLWIHGGGNTQGSGADSTFDGGSLSSRTDSVVVAINYRLNIFGFMALNDTAANITGNFALADKIAALEWVQTHITHFGGDPARVMIFGQSAGGWSIVDLVVSPKAKGLFTSAISQSGGASMSQTPAQATAQVLPFLAALCPDGASIDCLQAADAEDLLAITQNATTWITTLDGTYMVEPELKAAAAGRVNKVAYMAGSMPDEGQSLLGTTISPNATDFNATLVAAVSPELAQVVIKSGLWNVSDAFTPYNATVNVFSLELLTCDAESFIDALASSGADMHLYYYQMERGYALNYYDPYSLCTFPVGAPRPYYRCHSSDLYEVFGTYHIFAQPVREPQDVGYTNMVQDAWGAFARARDPNPPPAYLAARGYASTARVGYTWPRYTAEGRRIAALEYPTAKTVVGLPDKARCGVIDAEA